MKHISIYLIAAAVFLAVDAVWLGYVARDFYKDRIDGILLDQPRFGVAAGFYAVYVVGLLYFAVLPGLRADSLGLAVFNAALFGLFCYMTYDATNLSTVKGFDPVVAIVDIAWGATLSAFAAGITFWAAQRFSLWQG